MAAGEAAWAKVVAEAGEAVAADVASGAVAAA
jgi:hypothetical protein